MADLVITAASVIAGSNATKEQGTAGETVTAGQAVYKAAATQKWMRADADAALAEVREAKAVALNGASDGQPLMVQKGGDITIGATLTPGVAYYLSSNPGGICPLADVGAGEYVDLIGLAKTAAVLGLIFSYPNVSN